MNTINSRPTIPAGYFRASGEAIKPEALRRARYEPAPQDRIANSFARRGWTRVAGFANAIRGLDLKMRQKVNTRRADSARGRFDALDPERSTSSERAAAKAHVDRLDFKGRRLETKRDLLQAAREGKLEESAQQATRELQDALKQDGYEAVERSRHRGPASVTSDYLVSAEDGHRIKINSERPPRLARMIAHAVSAGHDDGVSGVGRAMMSTVQHALVGVYSAELWAKGKGAGMLSNSQHLDEGARARMDLRAARSRHKRKLLHGSLDGNEALGNAFHGVLERQRESGQARLDASEGPRYDKRAGMYGVAPPQTRFWERKVDAYYRTDTPETPDAASEAGFEKAREAGPAAQDSAPGRRAGSIARFALGVANLRNKAATTYHQARAESAAAKLRDSAEPDEQGQLQEKFGRHQAAADKRRHTTALRTSAMQGRLIETLKDSDTREQVDKTFPRLNPGADDGGRN